MKTLRIKKLHSEAIVPTRAYPHDAGADLYTIERRTVAPGEGYMFRTGIAADIPEGHYLHIHTRSSMAKAGWVVVGGICDSSYKGELFVFLRNIANKALEVNKFDRIAQFVLHPIVTPTMEVVDDIGDSSRGNGAFGSTGK